MDTITNIPVSSLTYALKGQKVLERYGYKAWAGRDHNRVSGCGYQLTVRGDPEKAKDYAKLLCYQAQLMAELPLDDPYAYTELVCRLMK